MVHDCYIRWAKRKKGKCMMQTKAHAYRRNDDKQKAKRDTTTIVYTFDDDMEK